jgi:(p)ppGpp synthase/HD superfamily hydrolase
MPNVSAALALATELHAGQTRKGSYVPYIVHPMGVAAIVAQYGGSDALICAALFHDVLEDCGDAPFARVRAEFGDYIGGIVIDCTRPRGESRPDYLRRLAATPGENSLLVALADKLDNARSIVRDAIMVGSAVWHRFSGGQEAVRAYYNAIDQILCREGGRRGGTVAVLAHECHQAITSLQSLSIADYWTETGE